MEQHTKTLIVYDRSRTVQDWKCPRSRYYGYEYDGRGLTTSSTSLELFLGIAVHDALAVIAATYQRGDTLDIDELGTATYAQVFQGLISDEPLDDDEVKYAREQATLIEGLIRGFYKHVWPQLLLRYPKILFTEAEMTYPHGDGLTFMSKPDLVLSTEDGSEICYIEYKSTSTKKEEWMNSWATAVQLHSTIKAVEHTHGTRIDSVIVQGLYKGYYSWGRQQSPMVYAYRRKGNPPFTNDEISYTYRSGFQATAIWELNKTSAEWVNEMPQDLLADQFPQTAPISINHDLVDSFFTQQANREWQINRAMDLILNPEPGDNIQATIDLNFPQRFDQCVPPYGRECPFKILCHGPQNISPYSLGFVHRTPHHETELKAQSRG